MKRNITMNLTDIAKADHAKNENRDLKILLAWEAGELSEGQAMNALGVDRVTAREMKINAIKAGCDDVQLIDASENGVM